MPTPETTILDESAVSEIEAQLKRWMPGAQYPASHNQVSALCATVRHLRERDTQYAKVLSDRLREMESLGTAFDELHEQHSDLQSQLEQLRAERDELRQRLLEAKETKVEL